MITAPMRAGMEVVVVVNRCRNPGVVLANLHGDVLIEYPMPCDRPALVFADEHAGTYTDQELVIDQWKRSPYGHRLPKSWVHAVKEAGTPHRYYIVCRRYAGRNARGGWEESGSDLNRSWTKTINGRVCVVKRDEELYRSSVDGEEIGCWPLNHNWIKAIMACHHHVEKS